MEEGEKDRLEDVDYDLARRQLDTVQESGRNGHCGGSRGGGSDVTTKVADARDLQFPSRFGGQPDGRRWKKGGPQPIVSDR